MIGYLEGRVIHFESDGILLLVGSIGYEVVLTPQMIEKLRSQDSFDGFISLYIYYHQTERQPKPTLIGFETLDEKEFFQMFITVDAIGPMKAVKAMGCPVADIAMAIEKEDVSFLTGLNGIGKRTAQKIIATLRGKVERFAAVTRARMETDTVSLPAVARDMGEQVEEVLVEQLGHSRASAKRMVKEAFERNENISTPEQLFDEIFQEKR